MSGMLPTMQQMSATQLGPLPPGPGAPSGVPGNMPTPRPPMIPPQLGGMGGPQMGGMPPQPPMPQQLSAGARPLQSIAPQLMGGVGSSPALPGGLRNIPMNLSMMARGGNPLRPGDLKTTNPSATMKLTPAEFARLGRFGDTYIAHLTPGEIAVPPQVQTPQLLQMLEQAFNAAHVDVKQFTVGSQKSSINPQTGAPEYNFLSALLPIAGSLIGNLIAPGVGGAIGGALGGGAGGLLGGGGVGGALLGAGLGGLGGYASGGAIGGLADTLGIGGGLFGSNAGVAPATEAGLAGAVPGTGISNLNDLSTMGGPLGASGAQGVPGPTGQLGTLSGPANQTMPTGATSPGTSLNPAGPLSSVSNSPVASAAFTAPNNLAGNTGGTSQGGFGQWLHNNWLPVSLGGAALAALMAGQNSTPTPPPAPGPNMNPLNTNYNQLLGNNTPLTTPQFAGYNPVRSVTGRNPGYNFFNPGGGPIASAPPAYTGFGLPPVPTPQPTF